MLRNRLADETSPYLLQHKDDPVAWQPWDTEALAAARAEKKPILLSVGYAACHWCHVMHHESFADAETAALMNELFINIKVDREERPDIDAIYMNALQMFGVQGGWPLTMFLSPEGEPFWGGTYFPDVQRYGQPSFKDVLRAVHKAFREQPDAIAKNRTAIREALGKHAQGVPQATLVPEILDRMADALVRAFDAEHGGLRGAPKFPQCALIELLWRAHLRTGDARLLKTVTQTLDHMCQGGIYDHLGGGFARYAVDERWLVPHFEKMLYDNAALIDILTLAWLGTKNSLYAERVRETVGWVLREMLTAEGAFAASLDADSEGHEGRFYVWSAEEVADVLGDEAAFFSSVYDVTAAGNWEGTNILNRLGALARLADDAEARLGKARAALFARRETRVRPGRDDKVLSDWNGLMIGALVRAGLAFGEQRWLRAAERAYGFIRSRMTEAEGQALRLKHSYRLGRARHHAIADGYANMARAALLLEEATGAASCLADARALVEALDRHYWDARQGGYFFTADDADALIARSRFAHDHPVPNANGTMLEVLMRLYHRTGETPYRARADALAQAFSGELERNALALGTYLNGFDFILNARQVVIRGQRGAGDTEALLRAAFQSPLPHKVLTVADDDARLPEGHPAAGAPRKEGRATAYVCRGTHCSLPITDADALRNALA
jgi:hypothetical protein